VTSAINGVSTGAIGTIDPTTTPPASETGSSSSSSNSVLDPQAFLKLLVAQLQYQDPTNPVSTSDFMNQTATLSEVQTMASMQSSLSALSSAQNAQEATAMIGKQVTYTNAAGQTANGVVSSTQLLASGPYLQVGNDVVALAKVSQVSAAPVS
jgi:flagellar basal-body rod modification protein FlgD